MHYLLFYDAAPEYLEKRPDYRAEHLKHAWAAHERGELVLAGALVDPVDGALLVFEGSSPEVARKFAREDPYVINGLVAEWRVREWATVAGRYATNPIRPDEL